MVAQHAEAALRFDLMLVAARLRIGEQLDRGGVEADPGQGHGGADVGVLREGECRLPCAAFEDQGRFADAVEVEGRLGAGAAPGEHRLAACVGDALQSADARRRDGIERADRTRRNPDARAALSRGLAQRFLQRGIGQRTHRRHHQVDAGTQHAGAGLQQPGMAGAFGHQPGPECQQCRQRLDQRHLFGEAAGTRLRGIDVHRTHQPDLRVPVDHPAGDHPRDRAAADQADRERSGNSVCHHGSPSGSCACR